MSGLTIYALPTDDGQYYLPSCIEWLRKLAEVEGYYICHALTPEGEHRVSGLGLVDGYCQQINTVYLYYSDYWHGNTRKYHHCALNADRGIYFGFLQEQTLRREQAIKDRGYKVVSIWEMDYKQGYLYPPSDALLEDYLTEDWVLL